MEADLMALSNYTNISAAVTRWVNRVGADDMTDNVEDFITIAQRRIQREVRVPPMEVLSAGLTITDGQAVIPSAMLDVKEMIAYDGSSAWDVKRHTYAKVRSERLKAGTGPSVFDTVGANFEFGPAPTAGVSVDVVYYQELEFISPSVDQNWFSQYAPELILFAALTEAASFLKDTEQEAKYEKKYNDAKEALVLQQRKAEYSGSLAVTSQ
jgi:hypothetical protein